MLGLPSWPHFPHSSRPGHIQVSALGQLLGQNGNIASMVSERQTACSVSQLASWQPEYFLLLGISSLSSAQLDKYQKLRERERERERRSRTWSTSITKTHISEPGQVGALQGRLHLC